MGSGGVRRGVGAVVGLVVDQFDPGVEEGRHTEHHMEGNAHPQVIPRDLVVADLHERLEQGNRRNTHERLADVDLETGRGDVLEPIRTVLESVEGMFVHEDGVTANQDHHDKGGDHRAVDHFQHIEQHLLIAHGQAMRDQMPDLLGELDDVHADGDGQTQAERSQTPARAKDDATHGVGRVLTDRVHGIRNRIALTDVLTIHDVGTHCGVSFSIKGREAVS